jgi:hypothetical protein
MRKLFLALIALPALILLAPAAASASPAIPASPHNGAYSCAEDTGEAICVQYFGGKTPYVQFSYDYFGPTNLGDGHFEASYCPGGGHPCKAKNTPTALIGPGYNVLFNEAYSSGGAGWWYATMWLGHGSGPYTKLVEVGMKFSTGQTYCTDGGYCFSAN